MYFPIFYSSLCVKVVTCRLYNLEFLLWLICKTKIKKKHSFAFRISLSLGVLYLVKTWTLEKCTHPSIPNQILGVEIERKTTYGDQSHECGFENDYLKNPIVGASFWKLMLQGQSWSSCWKSTQKCTQTLMDCLIHLSKRDDSGLCEWEMLHLWS